MSEWERVNWQEIRWQFRVHWKVGDFYSMCSLYPHSLSLSLLYRKKHTAADLPSCADKWYLEVRLLSHQLSPAMEQLHITHSVLEHSGHCRGAVRQTVKHTVSCSVPNLSWIKLVKASHLIAVTLFWSLAVNRKIVPVSCSLWDILVESVASRSSEQWSDVVCVSHGGALTQAC